jgi:hypothetical protein
MQKNISVIVVANNNPETLEKVLWGYNTQTFRNFEIILININSSNSVLQTIATIEKELFFSIKVINLTEVDSEDNYIKKAIHWATTNYILITEANCLAKPDFIEHHIKNRVEGTFLVGSSIDIYEHSLDTIAKELIYSSECFESNWLKNAGLKSSWNRFWISSNGLITSFLDTISNANTKPVCNNLSFWKADFDKVGGLNANLVSRLRAIGLKPKNIKYRAILLKLTI